MEGSRMRTLIADRGMGEPIALGARLASGKMTPPDVLNRLMDVHRVVLGRFGWYEQASDPKVKERVADRIFKALRAHMAGEEEIFYPEAARAIGDDELVNRALEEHKAARGLVDKLESTRIADRAHAELMHELRAEIEAHVDEEENELFPKVRESGLERYEIGGALAARRVDHLLEQLAPSRPARGRRAPQPIKEYPV